MSGNSARKTHANENTSYSEIKFSDNTKTKFRCKISFLLALLFLITTIIFIILFVNFFIKYNQRAKDSHNVCKTPDCFISAAMLARKMNMSVDPCADFGQFACGRFIKEAVIPQGKTRVEPFNVLSNENNLIMKGIITEEIKAGEPRYLCNMKRLYKSCMDEATIEEIGLKPYLADPLAADWPTLNTNWASSNLHLHDIISRYAQVQITPFFSYSVNADSKNSSRNVVILGQPALALPQEYFRRRRNDTAIMAYQKYLADIAVELGASREVADQDAKDVVDLEIALSKIMVPKEDTRDANKLYNPVTLDELSTLYPDLDFPGALRAAFSMANVSLSDDEMILNQYPTYMSNLSTILTLHTHRTLQNVFGFKYAISRVKDLTKRMREIRLEFNKVLIGATSEKPRWEVCLDKSSFAFGWGMSKYYVAKTFTETSKKYIQEMIDNLKKVFKQMIDENTWMEQATKDESYKKLAAMRSKVGYPDDKFQDADIETKYENYTISESEYYVNCQLIAKLDNIRSLLSLRKPVDRNMFALYPFVVNAYYYESTNEIVFLAGMLQPPFFSPTFQDSMNYGSIGVVIGHEITHGYDDQGSQFDSDGNLRNWWQTSDQDSFRQRTECIVKQTSGFFLEEIQMSLNGINTQGESVADNGGLKESFRAYKDLVRQKGEQPTLPGLDLTQDQLFFLAYSQSWCEKMTRATLISQVTSDVHPPGLYRIIGPLQNSEDFAKAYNCPRGSYMNPEKKCSVW